MTDEEIIRDTVRQDKWPCAYCGQEVAVPYDCSCTLRVEDGWDWKHAMVAHAVIRATSNLREQLSHLRSQAGEDSCAAVMEERDHLVLAAKERHEGHQVLAQLLVTAAPRVEPDDDLVSLVTQVDNLVAGLRAETSRLRALLAEVPPHLKGALAAKKLKIRIDAEIGKGR